MIDIHIKTGFKPVGISIVVDPDDGDRSKS